MERNILKENGIGNHFYVVMEFINSLAYKIGKSNEVGLQIIDVHNRPDIRQRQINEFSRQINLTSENQMENTRIR